MSGAAISNPRPISGKLEVTMIIHITSTGDTGKTERPLSSLKARPMSNTQACAMFWASKWRINFWMLSNMRRPSSMALRIDAKLSSVKTMSEASLATSEPVPIPIPTSDRFRDGESLTPSPVMAANAFLRCSASIMRTLVLGAQRAMTRGSSGRASTSSSDSLSNCEAVMTMASVTSLASEDMFEGRIPTSAAMARAVPGWSPVSM